MALPYPVGVQVVFAVEGIRASHLERLEKALETTTRAVDLNPGSVDLTGKHYPTEYKPWAGLYDVTYSRDHGTYTVKIHINPAGDCYTQDGSCGKRYEIARQEVIREIFKALDLFPDCPDRLFSVPLSHKK